MNNNEMNKKDTLIVCFGIGVCFCILIGILLIVKNSNNEDIKYQKQNIEYVSLIVEKHIKVFKIRTDLNSDNKKYANIKLLKFYVLDEYGDEYQIKKEQYDNIDCSTTKDSIRSERIEEIYQINADKKQTLYKHNEN